VRRAAAGPGGQHASVLAVPVGVGKAPGEKGGRRSAAERVAAPLQVHPPESSPFSASQCEWSREQRGDEALKRGPGARLWAVFGAGILPCCRQKRPTEGARRDGSSCHSVGPEPKAGSQHISTNTSCRLFFFQGIVSSLEHCLKQLSSGEEPVPEKEETLRSTERTASVRLRCWSKR